MDPERDRTYSGTCTVSKVERWKRYPGDLAPRRTEYSTGAGANIHWIGMSSVITIQWKLQHTVMYAAIPHRGYMGVTTKEMSFGIHTSKLLLCLYRLGNHQSERTISRQDPHQRLIPRHQLNSMLLRTLETSSPLAFHLRLS